MDAPRFPFARLERALIQMNGFPDEWQSKVIARLRQLHTLGLPKSGQRPRGRAAYKVEDLCQVGLVFELIQNGVTTTRAVQLVQYFWDGWLSGAFLDAYRARGADEPVYLFLDPTDLDGFQKIDHISEIATTMGARGRAGATPNIPFAAYTRSELFGPGGPLNEGDMRLPGRGIVLSLTHFLRRLEAVMMNLGLADAQQFRAGLAEFAREREGQD